MDRNHKFSSKRLLYHFLFLSLFSGIYRINYIWEEFLVMTGKEQVKLFIVWILWQVSRMGCWEHVTNSRFGKQKSRYLKIVILLQPLSEIGKAVEVGMYVSGRLAQHAMVSISCFIILPLKFSHRYYDSYRAKHLWILGDVWYR